MSRLARTLDTDKGESDGGLPLLGRLEDEVVQRLTDLVVLPVVRVGCWDEHKREAHGERGSKTGGRGGRLAGLDVEHSRKW